MLTYAQGMRKVSEMLENAGIVESEVNARELLFFVCDLDFQKYLFCKEKLFLEEEYQRFMNMAEQRAKHIPLQYLTNCQNFYGLDFYVNESVLIPRLDTEVLVEYILNNEEDGGSGLDVCTGSGCIAICLKKLGKFEHISAIDISKEALLVAEKNAKRHDTKITWVHSDMFDALSYNLYDFIVSNPPYIPSDIVDGLDVEVREYEPRLALDGNADGLDFYRILAKDGKRFLKNGGRLYLEIGHDQANMVSGLLMKSGFCDIRTIKDLAGKDRVIAAKLNG